MKIINYLKTIWPDHQKRIEAPQSALQSLSNYHFLSQGISLDVIYFACRQRALGTTGSIRRCKFPQKHDQRNTVWPASPQISLGRGCLVIPRMSVDSDWPTALCASRCNHNKSTKMEEKNRFSLRFQPNWINVWEYLNTKSTIIYTQKFLS